MSLSLVHVNTHLWRLACCPLRRQDAVSISANVSHEARTVLLTRPPACLKPVMAKGEGPVRILTVLTGSCQLCPQSGQSERTLYRDPSSAGPTGPCSAAQWGCSAGLGCLLPADRGLAEELSVTGAYRESRAGSSGYHLLGRPWPSAGPHSRLEPGLRSQSTLTNTPREPQQRQPRTCMKVSSRAW